MPWSRGTFRRRAIDPANPFSDWRRQARLHGTLVQAVDDVNDAAFISRLNALRPWAFARGEQEGGVTWHQMTTKIDVGVIAAQQRFSIAPFRTEHGLYREAVYHGARLMLALIDAHERGETPRTAVPTDLVPSYDSLPTRAAYRDMRRRGHRLFSWKELIKP